MCSPRTSVLRSFSTFSILLRGEFVFIETADVFILKERGGEEGACFAIVRASIMPLKKLDI